MYGTRMKSPPCANEREAALRRHAKKAVVHWIGIANERITNALPTLTPTDRIEVPAVRFDLSGGAAGMAVHKRSASPRDRMLVRINAQLLRDYPKEMIQETVPHEVAHVVAPWVWGHTIRPHGREWKTVMQWFGKEPTRCHTMTVESTRRLKRYRYQCACRDDIQLTKIRHNKIRTGTVYTCRSCRQRLVHVIGT